MKKQARNALLDRAHKGFVWACLGLTAYGSYLISLRVYRYFTVIAPAKQAYQRELLQKAEKEKNNNSSSSGGVSLDTAPELKM